MYIFITIFNYFYILFIYFFLLFLTIFICLLYTIFFNYFLFTFYILFLQYSSSQTSIYISEKKSFQVHVMTFSRYQREQNTLPKFDRLFQVYPAYSCAIHSRCMLHIAAYITLNPYRFLYQFLQTLVTTVYLSPYC